MLWAGVLASEGLQLADESWQVDCLVLELEVELGLRDRPQDVVE